MRALTITNPWAGLVASGIKLIENRPRKMIKAEDFGQRFAIHASRVIDAAVYERIYEIAPELRAVAGERDPSKWHRLSRVTSAVIATAAIEDVYAEDAHGRVDGIEHLGDQRRWFFGPVGYALRDTDRFRRVHEQAVHFYRGDWAALYKSPQVTNDATARQVRRKRRPPQWGEIGEGTFTAEDGGPRQMGSVLYVRGCHGYAVNETQKPEGIVAPLVAFSVPPGGLVVDPFAGSGTTLVVARREGRRAIGIELRREQCERIVERLSQRTLDLEARS